MTKIEALDRLRSQEARLRQMGIAGLSLFGSVARGDEHAGSDVDLATRLDYARCPGLFEFVGIELELREMLGCEVDLVVEPGDSAPRLQANIDRDRANVF